MLPARPHQDIPRFDRCRPLLRLMPVNAHPPNPAPSNWLPERACVGDSLNSCDARQRRLPLFMRRRFKLARVVYEGPRCTHIADWKGRVSTKVLHTSVNVRHIFLHSEHTWKLPNCVEPIVEVVMHFPLSPAPHQQQLFFLEAETVEWWKAFGF